MKTDRHQPAPRSRGNRTLAAVMIVLVTLPLLGAASQPVHVEAIQATQEIPEESLLDVAIEVFDPGVTEPGTVTAKAKEGVFPEVRKSEARYIPMQLKETIQSTGQWGAVRVVPAGTSSAEVTVTGEIRKSTGKDLVVGIRVVDVAGREWFDQRFKQKADILAYSNEKLGVQDPYHSLYARIANEMLTDRERLTPQEIQDLRRISELRFASQLAPAAYEDYLRLTKKGKYRIKKLPATEDPMMVRVEQIRERDYMFVDTLNEYYSEFCASMEEPYDNWRTFSYDEQVALAELRRQARMRKIIGALAIFGAVVAAPTNSVEAAARDAAVIAGMAAIQSGIAKGKEAKIHAEAIRELGASFELEVAPLVVEVEGETIRLTGNREDQYAAWHQLLRQIYAAETGLPLDPNTATDLSVDNSSGQ